MVFSNKTRFSILCILTVFTLFYKTEGFSNLNNDQETISENVLDTFYIDISELHPGQSRYSQKNVEEKIQNFIDSGRLIHNQSSYSLGTNKKGKPVKAVLRKRKDALPVVKSPVGYLLIDGHHHVIASLQVGSFKIPVKVIHDCSDMPTNVFWELAKDNGWIHTQSLDFQEKLPPNDFNSLENDPNRYFAGIARKPKWGTPLWIKDKETPPFAEFKIADILYQNHLIYNENMSDNERATFTEEAKKILQENQFLLPPTIKLNSLDS